MLNSLLNENRAIVSEIAGTTRDTIEETLNIDGVLFRLIDTAGIREHSSDLIESIGIERSLEKMRAADVVIYLFDVNEISVQELQTITTDFQKQNFRLILVGNKIDIGAENDIRQKFDHVPGLIYLSARSGLHLEVLKQKLVDQVLHGEVAGDETVVTNARHYHMLQQMRLSLTDIRNGLEHKIPGDLLALDIRRALQYLGEITGEITTEDQLDYIFSKFCIGK